MREDPSAISWWFIREGYSNYGKVHCTDTDKEICTVNGFYVKESDPVVNGKQVVPLIVGAPELFAALKKIESGSVVDPQRFASEVLDKVFDERRIEGLMRPIHLNQTHREV